MALEWDGEIIAAVRLPRLQGALDRLIEQVEKELGARLPDLSRNNKQLAVKLLDQRGAFTLRRAVEDVADAMGVSRITVYNYLNALHR
jgi:predicted transcriptional regulator YheO